MFTNEIRRTVDGRLTVRLTAVPLAFTTGEPLPGEDPRDARSYGVTPVTGPELASVRAIDFDPAMLAEVGVTGLYAEGLREGGPGNGTFGPRNGRYVSHQVTPDGSVLFRLAQSQRVSDGWRGYAWREVVTGVLVSPDSHVRF